MIGIDTVTPGTVLTTGDVTVLTFSQNTFVAVMCAFYVTTVHNLVKTSDGFYTA